MLHARSRPGLDGVHDGLIDRYRALPVLQDRQREIDRQIDDDHGSEYQ